MPLIIIETGYKPVFSRAIGGMDSQDVW